MSRGGLDSFRINLSNEQHLWHLFKGKVIRTKGEAALAIDRILVVFVTLPLIYTHIRFLYVLATRAWFLPRQEGDLHLSLSRAVGSRQAHCLCVQSPPEAKLAPGWTPHSAVNLPPASSTSSRPNLNCPFCLPSHLAAVCKFLLCLQPLFSLQNASPDWDLSIQTGSFFPV